VFLQRNLPQMGVGGPTPFLNEGEAPADAGSKRFTARLAQAGRQPGFAQTGGPRVPGEPGPTGPAAGDGRATGDERDGDEGRNSAGAYAYANGKAKTVESGRLSLRLALPETGRAIHFHKLEGGAELRFRAAAFGLGWLLTIARLAALAPLLAAARCRMAPSSQPRAVSRLRSKEAWPASSAASAASTHPGAGGSRGAVTSGTARPSSWQRRARAGWSQKHGYDSMGTRWKIASC